MVNQDKSKIDLKPSVKHKWKYDEGDETKSLANLKWNNLLNYKEEHIKLLTVCKEGIFLEFFTKFYILQSIDFIKDKKNTFFLDSFWISYWTN